MEQDFGASHLSKMDADQQGQFQIRVHIIEARQLKGRDANGMSDPVCTVEALDEKKTTKKFSKTTNCTFDEMFFFETVTTKNHFFQGKIGIKVMDANTIRRNVEIGTYDFDVDYIYKSPGHEIFRQWVVIADRNAQNAGFLKVSITVLAPGDTPVTHKEEEEYDDASESGQDLQSMVMLPPSISVQNHALEINLFKADHLPKMDTFGKCDGFAVVSHGKSTEKSSIVKNSYSPTWMEKLVLQATTPSMVDLISVQLRDWDAGKSDDIIGTVFLRFSELIDRSKGIDWAVPRWINFYGAPEDGPITKKDISERINKGELDGIVYRGSLLMSAQSKQVPDVGSRLGVKKIDASELKEPSRTEYVLRFHLYEVCQILDAKELSVDITFGWFASKGEKTKINKGTGKWFVTFPDLKLDFPRDPTQIPDLFINVNKGNERICFIRLKATELTPNNNPSWKMLKPDPLTGDPEKHSGFILFSAQFGTAQQLGNRTEIKAPNFKKFQLRAHIYQGRDLPSGDDSGSSDPYVVVSMGTASIKSQVKDQTCFPVWNETLISEVELPDQYASDVHVLVYDYDKLTKDDFLGRFSVSRSEITDQFPPTPKWYPIFQSNPQYTEGEILASFQLIPLEQAAQYPTIKIAPKARDCILQISLVGLRDLLPYALLPIGNPFIEFDSGQGIRISSGTSKIPSGKNPNYLKKLELPLQVPEDPLYAPSLNIRVFDDRVISKPNIATRSLSLASWYPWNKDPLPSVEQDTEIKVVNEIPGAPKEAPKEEQHQLQEEVKIEIPEPEYDETQPLLSPGGEKLDIRELRNQMIRNLKDKTTSVAETVPKGLEDVPDENANKRKTTEHELELEFQDPPFGIYSLYRAKKSKGKMEGLSTKLETGKMKARFRIIETNKKGNDDSLDLEALFKPTKYVVRFYILEGYNLVPTDPDGSSNPYICISCLGKYLVKDVKTEKQNTSRPMFYQCYELTISFPEQSVFTVEVWDYDKLKDDLIGGTKIDLESRIACGEWKNLKQKPIEQRTLWNPISINPQGVLKLWVDILTPEEAIKTPKESLSPPLPRDYELRVIIWETRNVIFKDKGMSDIFITGYPEGQSPQVTDTHWRCDDGKGLFNWRMKFPIVLPTRTPTFKIQVWDKDILKPNDAICEANLNLHSFYRKAYANKSDRETLSRQWISMTHSSNPGQLAGEVEVTFELLSREEANRFKNGFGRSEPNDHPQLPPPKRPETSFNPLSIDKYITKVFWKNSKWKIYGIIACICCCCCIGIAIYLLIRFYLP